MKEKYLQENTEKIPELCNEAELAYKRANRGATALICGDQDILILGTNMNRWFYQERFISAM